MQMVDDGRISSAEIDRRTIDAEPITETPKPELKQRPRPSNERPSTVQFRRNIKERTGDGLFEFPKLLPTTSNRKALCYFIPSLRIIGKVGSGTNFSGKATCKDLTHGGAHLTFLSRSVCVKPLKRAGLPLLHRTRET
jgi:hypothetical protein